jgi:hypothetical protein
MNTAHRLLLTAELRFGGAVAQVANSQTNPPASQPIVVIPCMGCSTFAKLSTGATAYMNATLPADGTVLLLFSNTNSASGYFRVSSYRMCSTPNYPYYVYCSSGGTLVRYVASITLSDAEAAQLDSKFIAKSVGSVTIPAQYGTSAGSTLDEDANSGLRNAIPIHLNPITQNFTITLNGKTITVTPGVTEVVIKFPDGSKITMRLVDPLSTIAWIVVSRTDANGNPVAGPNGAGSGGGGGTPGSPNPQPPNPQPNPAFYCPVEITHNVCIVDVTYTGGDCPTSGHVDVILRPCGT